MFETDKELELQLKVTRIEIKHLTALKNAVQSAGDKRDIQTELYELGQRVSYIKYKLEL